MLEFLGWVRTVMRRAWKDLRQHPPTYVVVAIATAGLLAVVLMAAGNGWRESLLENLAVAIGLLLAGSLWALVRAPFLIHRELLARVAELEEEVSSLTPHPQDPTQIDRPHAHVRSFPLRESERFGRREWRVLIQNIGGATGTFSAQMEPIAGFGRLWRVPWLASTATLTIEPFLTGELLVFGDRLIDESLITLPVELEPDGAVGLVEAHELEKDGYGFKDKFRLTISCTPPMARPVVRYFLVFRGGIRMYRHRSEMP